MMRLVLILIILLNTFWIHAQSVISGLNLSNRNDSILVVTEYLPKDVYDTRKHSYNFETVDALCQHKYLIDKNVNSVNADREGQTVLSIVQDDSGALFEQDMYLNSLLKQTNITQVNRVDDKWTLMMPMPNAEYEHTQVEQWEVVSDNGKSAIINANVSIDVSGSKDVFFPFGKRICKIVTLTKTYTPIDAEFTTHIENITDIVSKEVYVFNTFRGVLVGTALYVNQEIQQASVWQEIEQALPRKLCNASDDRFQLYPNPNYGMFNVYLAANCTKKHSFRLFNIIGKELYHTTLDVGKVNTKIELPFFSKGTYLYTIENEDGQRLFTRRLAIVNP